MGVCCGQDSVLSTSVQSLEVNLRVQVEKQAIIKKGDVGPYLIISPVQIHSPKWVWWIWTLTSVEKKRDFCGWE